MVKHLVLPVARLTNVNGRSLPRKLLRLNVHPYMIEPVGTPGRRICIAHDFEPEHLQDLSDLAAEYGVNLNLILFDNVPANWTYPAKTAP